MKKIKQERLEKSYSQYDDQQNSKKLGERAKNFDGTQKKLENSELKANTNIYNVQYQRIMEQIKQIYSEQSTAQNHLKIEQEKQKKDKKNLNKIACKTEKEMARQKVINQVEINIKYESEQQREKLNKAYMQFNKITSVFMENLKVEFEKAEKELFSLFNK
ncbi:unnamed protein product [Paramecium sonneborni]|uniref:Uncharacterized protein n=1 Tax=Paramecium sonneborni TaxID=65129 RepID=A0A8S1KU83_9CILI|nr:unnamed protein product [Paramecium sonneborni]